MGDSFDEQAAGLRVELWVSVRRAVTYFFVSS